MRLWGLSSQKFVEQAGRLAIQVRIDRSLVKPDQGKGNFYKDFVDKPLEMTIMASSVSSQFCATLTLIIT